MEYDTIDGVGDEGDIMWDDELNNLFKRYHLSNKEKNEFFEMIKPIYMHEEFQKRLDSKIYPHHGNKSLGSHILNDAIVSYKVSKRKKKWNSKIDVSLAVTIAMFHDLYELPWQNSKRKKKHFINKHGFIHPIEAIINAYTWFPEYFIDEERSLKIIDGVIHHMFPFPVRVITSFDEIELNNTFKIKNISEELKNKIITCTRRNQFLSLSFSKSNSIEGRIVSFVDTEVSMGKEIRTVSALFALFTGINISLKH